MQWAIEKSKKIDNIGALLQDYQTGHVVPSSEGQDQLQQICSENGFPVTVLQSIFSNLAKSHCRLWMSWNCHCLELLRWSRPFVETAHEAEENLKEQWDLLIMNSQEIWRKLIGVETVMMEFETPDDQEEEDVLEDEALQFHENPFPFNQTEDM
ncbi:hypothetical protein PtA15_8A25 [Puccinia triticina]|uniref:Uncharacterized protein n=1 Tax=Puccinia triticina TaxID=208348 RepID=A0ABY7CPK6_9BASI|nr:uncharacterized protein PtA15_8A25 [Puccinia triticina]WAQ87124.1 hypothetical protein PtA15_8A25 [Puccinia triticina]